MNCTTESANLRYGALGYEMDAYEKMRKMRKSYAVRFKT